MPLPGGRFFRVCSIYCGCSRRWRKGRLGGRFTPGSADADPDRGTADARLRLQRVSELEPPSPAWAEALARIVSHPWRRVVVIGATDVGKSSFIRMAMASAAASAPAALLDCDPGQKMVGPP